MDEIRKRTLRQLAWAFVEAIGERSAEAMVKINENTFEIEVSRT